MEVRPDQAAGDVARYAVRLGELRELAVQIAGKHPKFDQEDFRRTVFVKICSVCDSAGIAYLFLGKCLMKPDWWHSKNGLLSIPGATSDSAILAHVESFFTLIRCGLTHLIFSQVETTLRAILRALAPEAASSATAEFKSVYDCLLRTYLKRENGWQSEIRLLDFFRAIRNLIHNNGLYRSRDGQTLTFTYRNIEYMLEHGKNANFLPMPVIFDVIGDTIAFLGELIDHPRLAAHSEVIADPVLKPSHQL